jgi:membrane-associated phospholipid phosphatase
MDQAGPGEIHKTLSMFEAFAHGAGIGVILLTIYLLDPLHRRFLPRIIACVGCAGFANFVLKLMVGRMRPQEIWKDGLPNTVSETFVSFMPALHAQSWHEVFHRGVQSFPSGHSATAAAFAIALAWVYPRGRWLFAFLAVVAMLQRVECGAHFPSDTLAGAAVGSLVAALICDPRLFGRWFKRWEQPKSLAESAASR